ncbi:MAG: hypothetical protein ACXWDN_13280 [Limisphaerales bacterium]
MMYRVVGALVASLSVGAIALAPNPAFAGSATPHGAVFASPHAASHLPAIRSFRHHRRGGAIFFPGVDAFDYGTPSGEPLVDPTQPPSGDVHYTYTQDVPWDWAHRYPPAVEPSTRPYVSSCPEETTTFPGRDGKDQTVSVMRCY